MQDELTRRRFLSQTAGGLVATTAGATVAGSLLARQDAPPAKRPNIILIFDDQLRRQACSVYDGYVTDNVTMPNAERLAKEGLTFNHALSICPLCTPWRGMLQTGRYPTHSGIVVNFIDINPRERCLAHMFRDGGYDTAFIGKWHLWAGSKRHDGKHAPTTDAEKDKVQANRAAFLQLHPEPEFVPLEAPRAGYDHFRGYNFHTSFNDFWYFANKPRRIESKKYETDTEIDLAMEFISQRPDKSNPFFMVIAPHPPHPPFTKASVPAGYLQKIPAKLHWSENVPPNNAHRKNSLPARCYYSMIKCMDDNLGRLLDFLDHSNLSDDTIVVFTADHGEMLGSHNRNNKMVPYAESVDLPLIMRWPGHIPANERTDVLQTPLDYVPTLCALAGLRPPEAIDGVDLSDVVLGRKKVNRDAVYMANYVSNWDYFDTGTIWPEWRGLRTPQFTYAKWLNGKEELYDNPNDPGQLWNLAEGASADIPHLKQFRARLKELMAVAHDEFLPGTAYADWYDDQRRLIKTALGPVGV